MARFARVLVVEDEDDLRLTIRDWLVLRGHTVSIARDGLEALKSATEQPFDVVITDLKMPRCDGLQLLTSLKNLDPRIEVIFLTGQASMEDAIEALRRGRSFDFLQKPLHDFRRLDEVVARAMEHRHQQGIGSDDPEQPAARWERLPPAVAAAITDNPSLQITFRYIEIHFRSPIGLSEVAEATGYSPAYLTNLVRRTTGKTVQQWIVDYKMEEAQRLLAESDWSVQRIATTLGYMDTNNFHRQFRKLFDVAPLAWRQSARTT
jgi:YesN/AraC family two-component response regulator